MPLIEQLALLTRSDKWYLGNAGMLIYAPPFPQYLDTPGFWDECHYGDLAVPRLLGIGFAWQGFTARKPVSGKRPHLKGPVELLPRLVAWNWRPDRIAATYRLSRREGPAEGREIKGLTLHETRLLGPDDTLHCRLQFECDATAPQGEMHIVAWTMRQKGSGERADVHGDFGWDGQALSYIQAVASRAHARGIVALPLRITLSADTSPDSVQITPRTPRTPCPGYGLPLSGTA